MAVQQRDLNGQRIALFRERYGEEALDLACHGAFPLTLTTELLYCLREQFDLGGEWYGAADVLLSGFCRSVGHDLYEMDGELRNALLHELAARFPGRLAELEAFMVGYIRHRLAAKQDWRALALGDPDPERMHWTVLACFRSAEVRAEIERALQEMVATEGNLRERLRLAALVESTASLLGEENFKPILLELAEKVADGEPVNEQAAEAAAMKQAGFPLKRLMFEYAEVVVGEAAAAVLPIESLGQFRFETVTLDQRGEVEKREEQEATYFAEPLGETGPYLEMVAIPGGSFEMGSPEDEPERFEDEGPQHGVTVRPFFMGRYALTQGEWRAVAAMAQVERELAAEPSHFKGDDRQPVEQVSWEDAVEFCARLSQHSGRSYRLPSEAEWEYACRAGTMTPFAFGEMITPEFVNYNGEYSDADGPKGKNRGKTTVVGSFPANAFGLHDMHGNVWEWCADDWQDNYDGAPDDGSTRISTDAYTTKVRRGGSWSLNPRYCRSAIRYINLSREDRFNSVGFRVMCEAPRTP